MVSPTLFLGLLASQPAPAVETAEVPVCTMTTPRGDALRFFLWGDPAPNSIRMTALPGSAWPAGTLVGTRPQGETGSRFDLGSRDGFRLELSSQAQGRSQRAATLLGRANGEVTLPLAYGFCQDEEVAADPPEPLADRNLVGADHAAFDSEQWPVEDCALLLSNGRRIRIDPTLERNGSFSLLSTDLWSGRPVNVTMRDAGSAASFGQNGTPQGVRVLFSDFTRRPDRSRDPNQGRAPVLVRFQDLNEPSLPGVTGYAISGMKQIIRRPVMQ